jgi:hypothetical protein
MTKIKNDFPQVNITNTNQIKYLGNIPTCALTEDCTIDETNLTYLISILLTRYCEEGNILDTDFSSIDLTCLITSNPDIELPENITLETLISYYKNHFCNLYSDLNDLHLLVNSMRGLICLNDIVQLDQNESILIDPLFNDLTNEVLGTLILTIVDQPINGVAVIADNKITYTPDEDFFGNDQIIYQITKGDFNCSAKISIRVNEIISNQTITDIVVEQITTILQSDEYWDIGLDVGTKLSVTESKLAYFNLIGGSWGAGLPGTRYSKWAICNGNNGTDDYKGLTTRGYDVNDSDYDDASSTNSAGSDSITLAIGNIPAHRHTGVAAITEDGSEAVSLFADANTLAGITKMNREGRKGAKYGSGSDQQEGVVYYNSGDGTDNIDGQGELLSSPSSINIRNKYFTEIIIQKIA